MANVVDSANGSFSTSKKSFSLEDKAASWSQFTLSWFTSLMRKAKHKILDTDDIGEVSKTDESERNFTKLISLWESEVKKKGKQDAKLISVWFKFVGNDTFLKLFFFALVDVSFQLLTPLFSMALLKHLEGTDILNTQQLITTVVCLSISPGLSGIFRGRMLLLAKRKAMQVYAALTTAVYRKTMKLSAAGKASVETGQVINMLSADASNAMEQSVAQIVPLIMGLPIIIIALILLYTTIGGSMFAGFGFLFVSIPLNLFIFRTLVYWYKEAVGRADKRVKLINELISGIRIVKFYAWEKPFKKMIESVRGEELEAIKYHAYWMQCGMMVVFMQIPQLMQLVVFCTYALVGGTFKASVIFTTIQLFNVLRGPVSQFPSALSQFASLIVATKRIGAFLKREETSEKLEGVFINTAEAPLDGESCIIIKNGKFAWRNEESLSDTLKVEEDHRKKNNTKLSKQKEEVEKDGPDAEKKESSQENSFSLSNVNVDIKAGELVMIVGTVGSGKSSLLMSVLNEIPKLEGSLTVKGKLSLIQQNAWITNSSLRDNILFGAKYEKRRYKEVLRVCGLEPDIENFDDGDQIMIGERGINLSGGQKTRVGLARAVYSKSDIILLDCPLAAVDSHVGDHIFNKCIKEYLSERCRLFATNQTHRLSDADKIIVLENGKVVAYGKYNELVEKNIKFTELMKDGRVQNNMLLSDKQNQSASENATDISNVNSNSNSSKNISSNHRPSDSGVEIQMEHRDSSTGSTSGKSAKKLIADEERAIGHVAGAVWDYFFKSAGYCQAFVAIFAISIFTYFQTFITFVLAMWTNDVGDRKSPYVNGTLSIDMVNEYTGRDNFFLGFYGIAAAVSLVIMMLGGSLMARLRVKVAKKLHGDMLARILRAPVSFFDVTPSGRIMNRFSKEQNSVDMTLTTMIAWSFVIVNFAISAFLAIVVATYGLFLIILIPLIILYYYIAKFIRHTSIEVQRLEAIARSPLYAASTEILGGVETIRAFKQVGRFEQTYRNILNKQLVPFFLAKACIPVWMMMRINILSSIIIGSITAFVVMMPTVLPPGFVGLSITFGLTVTQTLMMVVNISVYAEIQMNAIERIKYYAEDLPEEKAMVINETAPPDSWPLNGSIKIHNLVAGYREGPDILKSISLEIEAKQKIGIVGRTGSGKSSLLVTLFRIIEPRSGQITIDGVDVANIGLEQLRTKIGIIPQDPVLFSGTLRHNLDPFQLHSDAELWNSLEQVSLKTYVSELPGQFQFKITEGGKNFSVGQRQLLCMARALLLDPKILLLDEATAQVDKKSDMMLQKMIRKCFDDKTVLTIAHRLDTIMDSDKILVLDDGNIAEYADPRTLIENKVGGKFYSLVYAEGKDNAERLISMIPEDKKDV
jgi:ATP-binding cassette, subfamily C (CFTR/MRP), member 1